MLEKELDQFAVSGWDDDIEEEKNPHENHEKEILWATEKQKRDIVKKLIEKNPKLIDAVDNDGYTPLHRACYNNDLELVDLFLKNGANISAKTDVQWQPLHSSCQWNHFECVNRLLQYGADVNAKTEGGQTPLHIAASHGTSYETVQLLLSHPYIDPTIVNANKETAFDIAKRSSRFYNVFEMSQPYVNGIK